MAEDKIILLSPPKTNGRKPDRRGMLYCECGGQAVAILVCRIGGPLFPTTRRVIIPLCLDCLALETGISLD